PGSRGTSASGMLPSGVNRASVAEVAWTERSAKLTPSGTADAPNGRLRPRAIRNSSMVRLWPVAEGFWREIENPGGLARERGAGRIGTRISARYDWKSSNGRVQYHGQYALTTSMAPTASFSNSPHQYRCRRPQVGMRGR